MAADDVITKARELPSGAVFHRCALQVNPHHYDSTYRGNAPSGNAVDHAGAIVGKASDLGVTVLAITDHNHGGGVSAFRAAAKGRGIHIFPGFELSSSEGIHVLCIYAPDTADDLLARYLGGFGITDTNPSAKLADKAFVDILAKVREQGGVAIAAHVTNDKGLLKVLTGQACIQAWGSGDLLAIQTKVCPTGARHASEQKANIPDIMSLVSRVCEVSFRDLNGMGHSVEVSATSLYEAATLALKAFRDSDLPDTVRPGTGTTLTITLRRDAESHEANVGQVEGWLSSQGRTPREQALKVRLREMLGQRG